MIHSHFIEGTKLLIQGINKPTYNLCLLAPLSQSLMDKCIDRWNFLWWLNHYFCHDFWWMNALMDELIQEKCALVDK